jgi:hypothetical protein
MKIITFPSSKYSTNKQSPITSKSLESRSDSRRPFTMRTSPQTSCTRTTLPLILTKHKNEQEMNIIYSRTRNPSTTSSTDQRLTFGRVRSPSTTPPKQLKSAMTLRQLREFTIEVFNAKLKHDA